MTLVEFLARLNQDNISRFTFENEQFTLLSFPAKRVNIIFIESSAAIEMKVPQEKFKSFACPYFCVPNFMEINEQENEWILHVLIRLKRHLENNQTWLGIGHTFPFSKDINSINTTFKQSYFFLNEPWLIDELEAIQDIQFLGIIPIFEDEFDYKVGKGTYKFQKKLIAHRINETIDQFRGTVLKSKWRFYGFSKK